MTREQDMVRQWVVKWVEGVEGVVKRPLVEGCADLIHFYVDMLGLVDHDDLVWTPVREAIRDLCTEI